MSLHGASTAEEFTDFRERVSDAIFGTIRAHFPDTTPTERIALGGEIVVIGLIVFARACLIPEVMRQSIIPELLAHCHKQLGDAQKEVAKKLEAQN